jgi:hypothetical protein
MTHDAFPLAWPPGRARITHPARSRFDTSQERAQRSLVEEVRRMGGSRLVISTNVELRRDGLPYANRREPTDKGVAVYFDYKKRPMCFACDRWDRIGDNIYAIAKTIEALRGIERWGSGSMVEQAFTGFVALPSPKSPYEIIGVPPGASSEEIEAAFRAKAKKLHSDLGGSDAAMSELNAARAKLKGKAA